MAFNLSQQKVYVFAHIALKVESEKGLARNATYVFRFHWQNKEWKIIDPPGVMF